MEQQEYKQGFRQTEPAKNKTDDISSKVLKWLIFECVAVLFLFLLMTLALVLRAYYPENHFIPVERKLVSGEVFSGSTGEQADNRIHSAKRKILDGDVTIREDAPHFYSEDSSAPANASADDDGLRPLVRTVRDSNAEKASQTFPGSVITTETTTEYKGDTVIETVTTTETKGDTTVRNTVRTETKNGAVIRKTTSTSTTTVQNLSEDQ